MRNLADIEAEKSVIGSVLLKGSSLANVDLEPEEFTDAACRAAYEAILDLDAAGKPVDDTRLLKDQLTINGKWGVVDNVTLVGFTDSVPTGLHARHYAEKVRDMSVRRRMRQAGEELIVHADDMTLSTEKITESAQEVVYSLGADRNEKSFVHIKDSLKEQWDSLEKQLAEGKHAVGLTLGYIELDDALTGMHPGELIVIAGRPSMGKSTFAINMIHKIASIGNPVLFFSVEMSTQNVVMNMTSSVGRVQGQNLRKCALNQDELGRIVAASEKMSRMPVYIDDTPSISITKLRARSRQAKSTKGIAAVFVDYLQYVRGTDRRGGREQEVAEVSRGLKSLAKELGVPVIALAQLNRNTQGRKDPRPVLSDLRESGAIEQDADAVLLLHRPEYYDPSDKPGVMEVIIAKQRNGPTGMRELSFIGNQFRIENKAREAEYQESF